MPNSLEIYIISCGPTLDFSAKNKAGHTPLETAANSAFSSCLGLLKKHSNKAEDSGSSDNAQVWYCHAALQSCLCLTSHNADIWLLSNQDVDFKCTARGVNLVSQRPIPSRRYSRLFCSNAYETWAVLLIP